MAEISSQKIPTRYQVGSAGQIKAGLIELDDGKLHILHVEGLRQMIGAAREALH